VRSGELTRNETRRLAQQEARIRVAERKANPTARSRRRKPGSWIAFWTKQAGISTGKRPIARIATRESAPQIAANYEDYEDSILGNPHNPRLYSPRVLSITCGEAIHDHIKRCCLFLIGLVILALSPCR
jgi:hypothetical protein